MPFWNLDDEKEPPIRLRQVGVKTFQLLTGFRYRDPTTDTVHKVPAHDENTAPERGNQTDLASVPSPLWGLIASYGHQTRPALLHDRLCENARQTAAVSTRKQALAERREADRIFRVALCEVNVPWLRRWMMWAAVSVGAYLDFARLRFVLLCLQLLAAPVTIYAGIFFFFDGSKASLAVAAPAIASLLWLRTFRIPLIGAYIGALVFPLLILQVIVAVILWLPAIPEWLWKRVRGVEWQLPSPAPYRLKRSSF